MCGKTMCIVALLITCSACKGQGSQALSGADPIRIYRFDKELFRLK
jgi:hypothetical protein